MGAVVGLADAALARARHKSNFKRVDRALKNAECNEAAVELIYRGALGTQHTKTYQSHTKTHKIA